MDMMGPETYADTLINLSKDQLEAERKRLEDEIISLKKLIDNNEPDPFGGGREVRYKMSIEYLRKVNEQIEKVTTQGR